MECAQESTENENYRKRCCDWSLKTGRQLHFVLFFSGRHNVVYTLSYQLSFNVSQRIISVHNTFRLPELSSYQGEIKKKYQEILSLSEAVWAISTVYCVNIQWKV